MMRLLLAILLCGCASAQTTVWVNTPKAAPSGAPTPVTTWLFDESSGNYIDTVGSNDCTPTNSPPWVSAGVDFEKNSDHYGACGNIFNFDWSTDDVSICATIQTEAAAGGAGLLGRFDTTDTVHGPGWWMGIETSRFHFRASEASGNQLRLDSTTATANATWYHFCISVTAPATAASTKMYINATEETLVVDADTLIADAQSAATNMSIAMKGEDWATLEWDGIVGIIHIYDVAITQSDVTSICALDETTMSGRSETTSCAGP